MTSKDGDHILGDEKNDQDEVELRLYSSKSENFSPSQNDTGEMEGMDRSHGVRRSQSLRSYRDKTEYLGEKDEGFFLGRRDLSMTNVRLRDPSHITITEVAPSNGAIFSGTSTATEEWKTPVKIFSDKIRGKSKEDKGLQKRIRSYYKGQDELIKAFEEIQLNTLNLTELEEKDAALQIRAERLAQLSFMLNLCLLIAKAVAVALSSSISIISSLVDSAVDLLSGIIIWVTSRAIRRRNIYLYPGGKSRLEPIAIVILSVIMSLASFQLVIESIQIMIAYASKEGNIPTVNLTVILIAAGTVVTKFILYVLCYCYGRESSSVQALALDHRNDVLSNIVAIVCGYFGSTQFKQTTGEYGVVFIDPLGAILISIYILINWWKTGYEQIKLLTGHTADPNFLSKITWICLNHHQEIIYIDTVRAFHFGNNFLVEVDIVLPENMSLKESHNIGETLQQKLEKFPLVERAFVHLDYEIDHHPNEEHKQI